MAKPDSNGLYNPRQHPDGLEAYTSNPPTTAQEALKGVTIPLSTKTVSNKKCGIKHVLLLMAVVINEVEPLKTRDANRGSDARRAATNQQSLTLEDYQDFARRNGIPKRKLLDIINKTKID